MNIVNLRTESSCIEDFNVAKTIKETAIKISGIRSIPAIIELSEGHGVKISRQVMRKRWFRKESASLIHELRPNLSAEIRYSQPRSIENTFHDLALIKEKSGLDFTNHLMHADLDLKKFYRHWWISENCAYSDELAEFNPGQRIIAEVELWSVISSEEERSALLSVCDELYEAKRIDKNTYQTIERNGCGSSGGVARTKLIKEWSGPIDEDKIYEFFEKVKTIDFRYKMTDRHLAEVGYTPQKKIKIPQSYLIDFQNGHISDTTAKSDQSHEGIYLQIGIMIYRDVVTADGGRPFYGLKYSD